MGNILEYLKSSPVIAAVRNESDIRAAIGSKAKVVFILSGNLLNIKHMTESIKSADKVVCIHIDLIEGLGKDPAAIDFLKEFIKPDGIITTRANLAKYAKHTGMFTIQRLFIIDSHSLMTGIKNVRETGCDAVEVMPGIASKLIQRIKSSIDVPVIAGGLITTKEDITDSLSAGVLAVSTSSRELWNQL